MRSSCYSHALKKAVLVLTILHAAAGASFAQTVALTATPQTTTLPDGNTVPMWGWVCGPVSGATCTAMNGTPQLGGTTWQPPLITVPAGGSLTITLNNSLPTGVAGTSLTIVGQLGTGTGSKGVGDPTRESAARTDGAHGGQTMTTWTSQTPAQFLPPAQGARARSFAQEAGPGSSVTYNWSSLKQGTYLIETGTYPSIQGPMGLYGVLVVTTAPAAGAPGAAYTGSTSLGPYSIQYDADAPLLLSEIDPVQNAAVAAALTNPGSGFSETMKWSAACGVAPVGNNTCYPAAVNFTPMYYMVNGTSFEPTVGGSSAAPVLSAYNTGNVLLRFVNAGLRMHVPSVSGLSMSLIAEDGNVLPDVALAASQSNPLTVRVQSDVFLSAGKVYDVMVNPAATLANPSALPPVATSTYNSAGYQVFDRELSLSSGGTRHDSGMQTTLLVGGALGTPNSASAKANPDNYFVAPTVTLNVFDPGKGVVANDVYVSGVQLLTGTGPVHGALTLNPDGTFTYVPDSTWTTGATSSDSFQYYANNQPANPNLVATVTLTLSSTSGLAPFALASTFNSNVATMLKVSAPGVLQNDTDPSNYPLHAAFPPATAYSYATPPVTNANGSSVATMMDGTTVTLMPDGSFTVVRNGCLGSCGAAIVAFPHVAINSENVSSLPPGATGGPDGQIGIASLNFQQPSNLTVLVQDAGTQVPITDYKWIIEQDLSFKLDPTQQVNNGTIPPTLGTNFHTSYYPVIASGCTGDQSCERGQTVYDNDPNSPTYQQHVPAVCEGTGICVPSSQAGTPQQPPTMPGDVYLPPLDATGRPASYYISILPGDAGNAAFNGGTTSGPVTAGFPGGSTVTTTGHTMSGAPIPNSQIAGGNVTVNVQPNPIAPATVTAYVFEDDWPLNGEPDAGGGVDTLATQEVPLDDFDIILWDDAGYSGDATGQMTYDMFNEPLTNSLNGTIDPATGLDACPISNSAGLAAGSTALVGVIVVCPRFESDGKTPSPITGQAVVRNLMPGRFGITAHPGAQREARGEEWLQTNTLDGTHFLDSFIRAGEPSYFQEFGPGGYHVFFGEANPAIINARLNTDICINTVAATCNNTITGQVTNLHMARPTNEYLSDSSVGPAGDPMNYAALAHTTCYVSLGDPDGETFQFTKCDQNGNFTFNGIPDGDWALVAFDQWLDLIVDGTSKSVSVHGGGTLNVDFPAFTWQTHIWSNTFMDLNGDGIQDIDPNTGLLEPGLLQVPTRIRMRNGKINNTLLSDITGASHFNETFPLFNWYVIESDTTRFKGTGVHVVYDAGGTVDGPNSPYKGLLNSTEANQLPTNLRVPGAYYCGKADCSDIPFTSVSGHPVGGPGGSTGRVDPGNVITEGLQGFLSQTQILEWGKTPYQVGETGGIRGHVVYSSTRPFDDVSQQFQNLWEPLIPNVTVNLYREGTGPDGTISLQLIDTTTTSSWDAWAQGVRVDPATGTPIVDPGTGMNVPNMSCPGQDPLDPFLPYTLNGTANYLYPNIQRPDNSQFKCYDSLRVFNQVQPAPYDGIYLFPTPSCGHCDIGNVLQSDGTYTHPVSLIAGKYVVEVVPPPGYELVKEEDKNILIGDAYIAPVTQQFGAMSNIFIVPDQATINNTNPAYLGTVSATNYAGQNGGATNPTVDLGHTLPSTFGPGGVIVMTAPCVGAKRIVPDYMSISPESGQVAPFAGALRALCNRKEVTLEDQSQAQTDFFLWTKTPAASHFTGFILDDMSSEFDPASPAFGEKFAVPNLPISIRDFNGMEVSRHYSDQWGIFNGMTYSTWDVNPPNPTGYAPNMMVTCMNDPGPIPDPSDPSHTRMITDPMYNPQYSNFCYENAFMPADTSYLDTPVVPTTAFAEGYNPPDCNYPDATPAVSEVDGDGIGPWVSAAGVSLTINALGDQRVPNHAYTGPAASTAPFNQKFVTRHYGFGGTKGTVTIGGIDVSASVTGWSDSLISLKIPQSLIDALPVCASSYSQSLDGATTPAQAAAKAVARFGKCGQLVITAANGKQSVDAVTVTIGGFNGPDPQNPTPTPAYVVPGTTSIQSVIDAAYPGDIIIVPPGTYTEMVLMWKPVRLQGVGAASVTVNANTHPSGVLLEPWRRQVDCLFGLTLSGGLIGSTPKNPPGALPLVYDPSTTFSCDASMQSQIDPVPQEAVVGWDASINGNLAELLQEPSLMGAYEGAGITVLGKGVHANSTCGGTEQPNCTPLTNNAADCTFFGNFLCAPGRIDGMTFTNSSQGGGGIFLHGWNHYMEVSNNRIHGNAGTLGGGIVVGQPEAAEATFTNGIADAYLWNHDVYIHNNAVTANSSYGDELNSNTPASSGGVTLCLGSDYYKFNYNWVCGNFSTGDGGGFAHYGYSVGGHIEHNSFLFNQSYNTTITTHGGGIILQGGPPDGAACENATVDKDCPPGLTDGAGDGLVVNANLIMGNTAESGSGGGLRLQNINGADVFNNQSDPTKWNHVTITNNIIANNVAGWIGGGVSIYDAVKVDVINNTIVSNDDTASAGVLFDTLGAPNANQPPPGCDPTLVPPPPACTNAAVTTSNFQPAGLASEHHSPILSAAFSTVAATNATDCATLNRPNCDQFSNPLLANNVIWQNRAFHITTNPSSPVQGLQTVVTLTPQLNQVNNSVGVTGSCPSGATYWDIGVYGDLAAGDHSSTFTLNPQYTLLDDPGYLSGSNGNKTPGAAGFVHQYCNGSRVPPEIAPVVCSSSSNAPGCLGGSNGGITVPPGVPDINPFYPLFAINPAATTDEGNNFINMFYGPLSLSNPTVPQGSGGYNVPLGNYELAQGSPAISGIPPNSPTFPMAPARDFFGLTRAGDGDPGSSGIDMGAVEFRVMRGFSANPTSLNFTSFYNVRTAPQAVTVINTGDVALSFTVSGLGGGGAQFAATPAPTANSCNNVAPGGSCTFNVTFDPTVVTPNPSTATMNVNVNGGGGGGGTPAQTVHLTGTLLVPTYSVSQTSLTFSSALNVRTAAQTVIITNTSSNGAPLSISSVNITGASSGAGFAASSCPATLPATAGGNTCTVSVTFQPTSGTPNPKTANLNFNVGIPATPATTTVALTGTVIVPTYSVSQTSLTFNSSLNITSAGQTVVITNTSPTGGLSLPVNSTNISATGGTGNNQFSSSPSCTGSLAPQATCTITVTFRPSSATPSPKTANLNINVGAGASPATTTVALTGNIVVPTYTVSPNAMDFGSEFVGTTSPSQALTITNTSTNGAALNITGTPISGTGSNQYGQSSACPNTLQAGLSCVINVTFHPSINTTPGTKSATLTVTVSSPATLASPSATVTLTGNAVATTGGGGGGVSALFAGPVPALNSTGQSTINPKSGTITVTNNSSGAITLSADPTVTKTGGGPNSSTFSISTPSSGTQCVSGLTLNVGDQCTIGVTFNHPSSNSNSTAHVNLSDTLAGVGGTLTQSSSDFTAN
jgi:hypothetical protein